MYVILFIFIEYIYIYLKNSSSSSSNVPIAPVNDDLPPELESNKDSESDHENIDPELTNGDYYFTSYDNSDIHIQMLQVNIYLYILLLLYNTMYFFKYIYTSILLKSLFHMIIII